MQQIQDKFKMAATVFEQWFGKSTKTMYFAYNFEYYMRPHLSDGANKKREIKKILKEK